MRHVARAARLLRQRFARARRRRTEPHGLVLGYHRIAIARGPDPWRLCVSERHFREQLEVLRRVADLVPLADLAGRLRGGTPGRPVVALTFDDGYADNLDGALPWLERYEAPATVFVTTAWIGRPGAPWWDWLAAAILGPEPVPSALAMDIAGTEFRWRAGPGRGRATPVAAGDRARLHAALYARLLVLDDARRDAAMTELARQLGRPVATDPDCRALAGDELRRLGASALVEIGAHTVTHCHLPGMAPAAQAAEIAGSRRACERLVGHAPSSFAYPYGFHDASAAREVAAAGFARACTTVPDLVWAGGDPLQMPRFKAQDWSGPWFERCLRWFWLP